MKLPLVLVIAVALLLNLLPAFSRGEDRKPNVVPIMADDVGWEAFSCYGAEDYRTPHLDALAAKGVRFAHCYSTPICTTSRVQLMTGKYNFRNYTHFGYLSPEEKTFGHLMQEAGYATAVAGKWQLNNPHFPALRADPLALSGASRRKQIPCSSQSMARRSRQQSLIHLFAHQIENTIQPPFLPAPVAPWLPEFALEEEAVERVGGRGP